MGLAEKFAAFDAEEASGMIKKVKVNQATGLNDIIFDYEDTIESAECTRHLEKAMEREKQILRKHLIYMYYSDMCGISSPNEK